MTRPRRPVDPLDGALDVIADQWTFLLLREGEVLTKPLDASYLHGVTRDSVLAIARAEGYEVTERDFTVAEMLEWIREGEAALSGTAAVMSGVGTLIHDGTEHSVRNGEVGPHTLRLREALTAVQHGEAPDEFGWLTEV